LEEFNPTTVPNPMVSWGIIIATLGGIEDQLKKAKPTLGINRAHVGVDFPYSEQTFPSVVVGLNGLRVENSGFYTAENTIPRNQVLLSYGNVSLNVYTTQHNKLMTLTDYITSAYLLNLFERNVLAFPGTNKDWVALGYSGGVLEWSPFQLINTTYSGATYERLYTSSTNFKFKGEHTSSIDLATVSAITLEAIPLNRII
jgi:hypothetical protein